MIDLNYVLKMYDKETKQTGFMKHYLTLFSIVEGLETQRSFEFGTGISTMIIIEALKRTGGYHTSCDLANLDQTGLSQEFINNTTNWTYLQQNSNDLVPEQLDGVAPFDFVLHDGSHIPDQVEKDIKKVLPFMKKNSILLVHDTIMDSFTNLLTSTQKALSNTKHEILTLPYSCGLTIFRITEDRKDTVTPTWYKGK